MRVLWAHLISVSTIINISVIRLNVRTNLENDFIFINTVLCSIFALWFQIEMPFERPTE
jgi:hypothetical protein